MVTLDLLKTPHVYILQIGEYLPYQTCQYSTLGILTKLISETEMYTERCLEYRQTLDPKIVAVSPRDETELS